MQNLFNETTISHPNDLEPAETPPSCPISAPRFATLKQPAKSTASLRKKPKDREELSETVSREGRNVVLTMTFREERGKFLSGTWGEHVDLDRICVYASANSDDNSEKYSHYFI